MGQSWVGGILHGFDALFRQAIITGLPWVFLSGKVQQDIIHRFADVREDMVLGMAYTCSKEEAQEWKQEIAEKFPEYEIVEGPLSLSVACHIGPGAMAVTCMKKVR